MIATKGTRLETDIEHDLIRRAQAGDVEAQNTLIEHHYPFILRMTARSIFHSDEAEEYVSHAVEAFIRGVMGFRFKDGTRLLTYCGTAIDRAVRDARYRDRTIVPPRLHNQRTEKLRHRADKTDRVLSIDFETESGFRPMEPFVYHLDDRDERVEWLRWAINHIPPRDRDLLMMRMRGMKLHEVGRSVGLTKERVRQIQEKALVALVELRDQHHPLALTPT